MQNYPVGKDKDSHQLLKSPWNGDRIRRYFFFYYISIKHFLAGTHQKHLDKTLSKRKKSKNTPQHKENIINIDD